MQKENNKFKDQSVLGIITCNREEMLRKLVDSIDPDCVEKIFIINNGEKVQGDYGNIEILNAQRNPTPVGQGKNKFWRKAMELYPNGSHIFTLEDDIVITDNNVFETYINTALDSGILGQLSYGLHGSISGGNVLDDGTPNKRATVKYTKYSVDFYRNSFAAFTYHHSSVFKQIGFLDERYTNAGEHLDQYYKIFIDKKLKGVPFFSFPDILDSFKYIQDQDANHEKSVIRSQSDWMNNFLHAWHLFKSMYGVYPSPLKKGDPCIQDWTDEQLMQRLTEIEFLFANKKLI